MNSQGNRCFLVRHGETEWSLGRRHTGRTDLPLLPEGTVQAEALRPRLADLAVSRVLTSPLQRARETSRLAGLGDRAEVDPDLAEWDYGDFEGLTTAEILDQTPGWDLFTHGAPGGETAEEVGTRADRVIERVRAADGDVLCFAHGHLLRVLAARWLGLHPELGRCFSLDPASISILGWERLNPVVVLWNLS
ncbi:MAG TPA: histidine phosphatase family protein [Acidimicrobiales bacterium]|nr:histidine phosphatase family protein [Acidimicrobiales bacterium]